MGRPPGIRFHVTVAMRLEKELAEALERVAKEEERPMGSMARILVREAIEARDREVIADRKAAEVWNKVGKKPKKS